MGKNELALLVLLAFDVYLYGVADLKVRIVAELGCRDDTLALVSDVDDHFPLVDSGDRAFYDLVLYNLGESLVVCLLYIFLTYVAIDIVLFLERVPIELVRVNG